MAAEGVFCAVAVVEDVLQQHGTRSRGLDLESRWAEEAAIRRNEAAGWLRKTIGVVAARDLPAEPSEEEFRLGLRSGMILCNVLNKIQPGAVPKVVESPSDCHLIPDGAALSAYQYFENVRNYLVAVQEMGLPTFEASDLEQGGKSTRVVNNVLALKSYNEWKQSGGNGVWKFGGSVKPTASGKQFVRKNSDPFTGSLSRTMSMGEKSLNLSPQFDSNNMCNSSLSMLVRAILLDKKPEEVPSLVESVLTKVAEEFENRIACKSELAKTTSKDAVFPQSNKFQTKHGFDDKKTEEKNFGRVKKGEHVHKNHVHDEELKRQQQKQQMLFEQQNREITEMKQTLHSTKAGMKFMQMKFNEDVHSLGVHIHGLAQAASGYHKVLDENRKLYNQVQDLKGSIRVYCRVRPLLGGQSKYTSTVENIEDGTIGISTPSKYGKGCRPFNFNKVFGPSATQAEVFSDTQPLVRSVLDGYNVCIFAYGQTGSGKTYTMSGPRDLTEQTEGVNYRALGDLFLLTEQRKGTFRYDVFVQMIEIYNEQVRDLLVTDGHTKRLEIRNSSQTGLNVPEASLIRVASTSDVIGLMNLGQKNRAVGATALNDRSSRSHSCLTVHVQGKDLTSGNILRGCMHLVDLAGSERVDKSEVTGDRLKEAQHINKSLSALGDVIASLAQKNAHVPYRNSKLTQLLQDSLGGQAKTLMFVHISPEPDAVGETLSTLKFAERVATVELGAARINKDNADVKALKEQIASLKTALARKEGGESGQPQQKLYSSPCGKESSPYRPNSQNSDVVFDQMSGRKPMGDVGNIEVHSNSVLRQKKQSIDLDELLGNSPPWPPISSPGQNLGEEDRETSSGEWVDKVMVNKQDALNGAHNTLGQWEPTINGQMSDIYQKYLSDSSKSYIESSYNVFSESKQFDATTTEDLDELDAGTSDSSEPDLLWQFNQAKFANLTNDIGSKIPRPSPKLVKTPELSRNVISKLGPPLVQKVLNGTALTPQRNGRRMISTDTKRRAGNRK